MADGVKVEVKGADRLASTLNSAAKQLLDQTEANQAAGQELMQTAMGRAPRRTGRLAGSIHTLRADRVTVQVGSSVRYAGFQNYGTSRNRPTYFLTGALEALTTDVYVDYADQVLSTVKGA
jgi:HK97 gp10 family phage protein